MKWIKEWILEPAITGLIFAFIFAIVHVTILDKSQPSRDDKKYFKSGQLVEFTDWIFMEGYALGLKHRSLAQDSVYVGSKGQEAAELLNHIKEMLDGK